MLKCNGAGAFTSLQKKINLFQNQVRLLTGTFSISQWKSRWPIFFSSCIKMRSRRCTLRSSPNLQRRPHVDPPLHFKDTDFTSNALQQGQKRIRRGLIMKSLMKFPWHCDRLLLQLCSLNSAIERRAPAIFVRGCFPPSFSHPHFLLSEPAAAAIFRFSCFSSAGGGE